MFGIPHKAFFRPYLISGIAHLQSGHFSSKTPGTHAAVPRRAVCRNCVRVSWSSPSITSHWNTSSQGSLTSLHLQFPRVATAAASAAIWQTARWPKDNCSDRDNLCAALHCTETRQAKLSQSESKHHWSATPGPVRRVHPSSPYCSMSSTNREGDAEGDRRPQKSDKEKSAYTEAPADSPLCLSPLACSWYISWLVELCGGRAELWFVDNSKAIWLPLRGNSLEA